MTVLIKQAIIADPSSPHFNQLLDIFIADGKIDSIAKNIDQTADQIIRGEGLHVSGGWIDVFAHFCDPGLEFRETIETGANAAAAGGFTTVFTLPNTQPTVHSKSQVEYILQNGKQTICNVLPIGAATKNAEGKELAEMYDMQASGAIAFGDGKNSLQNSGLLLKALQYVKAFDGVIVQLPSDQNIGGHGLMHEGIVSTQLGLPGKPAIAEELMIARDIELAKYTDSKIHFAGVSTAKGLAKIMAAKKEGLKVSCHISPAHVFFSDEDLKNYDSNLKLNPPLRSKEDMLALRAALLNGEIDCVASHHMPQNLDNKQCEFEYAHEGMIGLESCFGVLRSLGMPISVWMQMQKLAYTIFNLTQPNVEAGSVANLTLFAPDEEYVFDASKIKSKSANSAFVDKKLKGKIVGVINHHKIQLNNAG
jgi:dihydroorotase